MTWWTRKTSFGKLWDVIAYANWVLGHVIPSSLNKELENHASTDKLYWNKEKTVKSLTSSKPKSQVSCHQITDQDQCRDSWLYLSSIHPPTYVFSQTAAHSWSDEYLNSRGWEVPVVKWDGGCQQVPNICLLINCNLLGLSYMIRVLKTQTFTRETKFARRVSPLWDSQSLRRDKVSQGGL